MSHIEGVDPDLARSEIKAAQEGQTRKWGTPLLNHLIYTRRAAIFRGAQAMWAGTDSSGLVDDKLTALANRRVAATNNCEV